LRRLAYRKAVKEELRSMKEPPEERPGEAAFLAEPPNPDNAANFAPATEEGKVC
jgi:hypothetical protein